MEAYASSQIELLTKFSNSIWILQFYNYFAEVKYFMNLLGVGTHQGWNDNSHLFEQYLIKHRKVLKFYGQISDQFTTFILKDKKYQKYVLDIQIEFFEKSHDQINAFYDMIDSLDEVEQKQLRFIKITLNIQKDAFQQYVDFIAKMHPILQYSGVNESSNECKKPGDTIEDWHKQFIGSYTNKPMLKIFPKYISKYS